MSRAKRFRKIKMANKRPSSFTKKEWAEHADFGTNNGMKRKRNKQFKINKN